MAYSFLNCFRFYKYFHLFILISRYYSFSGRKLSAQLRAKIRSLDEQYPVTTTTTTTTSPSAAPSGPTRKATYVMTANNTTSAAISTSTTTTTNIIHNELHGDDAKSLHSDSSLSDFTSGETSSRSRHAHEDHKTPVIKKMTF